MNDAIKLVLLDLLELGQQTGHILEQVVMRLDADTQAQKDARVVVLQGIQKYDNFCAVIAARINALEIQ